MFSRALDVCDVTQRFGALTALSDVSLSIAAGTIHAVIGENGAGKSTLMNVICGNLHPTAGCLRVDGEQVAFRSPLEAQRAGIAIAPQEILLAPQLTAAENVVLGRHARKNGMVDWRESRRQAAAALDEIDPTIDPDQQAQDLTSAQQQLVQIARVISTGARLLVFDEPTAALTDRESRRLFTFLQRFRASGGAALYVSHRLEEVLHLSDAISVMRDGRHVGDLDPARTSKDEMIKAMAGRDVLRKDLRATLPFLDAGEVAMRVTDLSLAGRFADVSFDLRKGEILAIGGLIGSGRTELALALFGATPPDSGEIVFFGKKTAFHSPAEAIRAGLAYLPEERKRDGIFPLMSVAENIALPNFARLSAKVGISWDAVQKKADAFIESMPIKASSGRQLIGHLSGGNQQKAILARWIMSGCRILILDEPTRGIDVKAKREIQTLLRTLAQQGLSIIYISSELQELLDVSDRVLLMHEGRVKGIVPTEGTSQEGLLAVAMS